MQPSCVLATVRYRDEHLATLREAFAPARFIHLDPEDGAGIEEALKQADVAILKGDIDERVLRAPHLRWVHCDQSGLNNSARPEVFERDLVVTGSAGRSAPALAQHVFFFALALTYDAPGLIEMQRRHVWRGLPDYVAGGGLWGKTMGIVGLGATGLETAALAKAFGMDVLGYRKSAGEAPATVDRLYCADNGDVLEDLLRRSDVVTLCVRLTDRTRGMIGAKQLKSMKRSAFLINIARGPVVDEAALITALREGTIAGAGLDVFEQEPLPVDAAVWDAPNTLITPHVTAEMPDLQARSLDIICENIRRYRADEPMLNVLTVDDIYTSDFGRNP